MSTRATFFSIYFLIGLLCVVVAVAAPGKEKRTKGLSIFGTGDALDAGLLIFISLLWPVWLLIALGKKGPKA